MMNWREGSFLLFPVPFVPGYVNIIKMSRMVGEIRMTLDSRSQKSGKQQQQQKNKEQNE
jgi:hypothetical protein